MVRRLDNQLPATDPLAIRHLPGGLFYAIRNPLTDGTWQYEWVNGRQLARIYSVDTDASVVYNENGLRVRKTVNGEVTNYTLHGKNIVHMAQGSNELHFFFDAQNKPAVVIFNGTAYAYLYNLQGDVIGLVDSNGTKMVSYTYDAWGTPISKSGTLASTLGTIQPFRYRGYVFDEDTVRYYVSSRYYNPNACRWVNADDTANLGADGSVLSNNLFAYCINSPINRFDSEGEWSLPNWAKAVVGAVATVAAVTITVATGGAALPVLIGVAASTVCGAAHEAISHRLSTGSWEGAGQAALDGAADGFMTGGLLALGGSIIGGAVRTIKNARSGITIGKMGTFEDVARLAQTRHYGGLKEFGFVKKVFGQRTAEAIGWWQNKCVVKGVMALKGAFYDCGGAMTGAYAKEIALTKGYQYLYNIWLM